MNDPKIRDIAKIQDLLSKIQNAQDLKKFLEALKAFGINTETWLSKLNNLDDYEKQIQDLVDLPDRFNDHFADRGWIIYESLSITIAKQAVEIADNGDIHSAERALVAHFSPETVRFWLGQLNRIEAFQSRMRLARLALKDYEEERYHACIPVVLALMDGLVNDINGHQGFFENTTELRAWNSIAAHEKGLVKLGKLFRTTRKKTRIEEITIPYRHGIMHGHDLGYDNQMVAAKTWAALFAVGDWAEKAEKGELEKPKSKPEITFVDVIKQMQQTQKLKQQILEWEPRSFDDYIYPNSESPEVFEEETPERRLVAYLSLWKSKNYGKLADYVPVKPGHNRGEMPQVIRNRLQEIELGEFMVIEIRDIALASSKVHVELTTIYLGTTRTTNFEYMLVNMDENGKSGGRNEVGYTWYVTNWNHFYPR